jgi:hypothetical protein
MDADETGLPAVSVKLIAGAGIAANLLFGVFGLRLFAAWRRASANMRYFLWLFGHSNMFVGSGYMLALSFANYGDIQELVAGLPHPLVIKIALTALGACVALATFVNASRTLEEFLGREQRARRAAMLSVIPYSTIGVLSAAAGALNPDGASLILASAAAASFGGNMPMAWLALSVRNLKPATRDVPVTPTRQPAWLAAAALSVILLFAVLAPGVPR